MILVARVKPGKKGEDTYTRAKASDCISFLLTPLPNHFLKTEALTPRVFGMQLSGIVCGN